MDLCAAVSQALDDVREGYSLEVSSPGLDRRLRKSAHFAAVHGREIAVTLETPLNGRSNFRGELVASGESTISLRLTEGGEVTLPLADIARAHVVYNFETDGGQRE